MNLQRSSTKCFTHENFYCKQLVRYCVYRHAPFSAEAAAAHRCKSTASEFLLQQETRKTVKINKKISENQ